MADRADLRSVPPDHENLERALKIGFAVVIILLIVAGAVQIGVFRSGANETSDDLKAIQITQAQADRNLAVQACSSAYARTYTFWDAEADRLFAIILDAAFEDRLPPDELLARFQQAGENESEMNRRALGVAELAADEAEAGGDNFACPAIPERLAVEPLDPTDPNPPPPL